MDPAGHRPPHAEHDTVLFIGHPGHELRVFHWLECTRPLVAVITDGSGGASADRIASTLRVLETVGARPLDSCIGFCSDRRAYEALLARDAEFFAGMLSSIEAALGGRPIACVASDAIEHFNPTHDVCCLLASKLADRCGRAHGHPVGHLVFPLDAGPSAGSEPAIVDLRLDDEALARKLGSACGYRELREEVDAALRAFGAEAFRRECLWHAGEPFEQVDAHGTIPYYERVGRDRQGAGRYSEVITLDGHVRPVARALRAWDGTGRSGPLGGSGVPA
jgi:hypothetical protein